MAIRSMAFSITGLCNYRCRHCYANAGLHDKRCFSLLQLKSYFCILKQQGVRDIFVGGGEPLLHPDFLDIVYELLVLDILPSISTNGSRLDRKILEELRSMGLCHNIYVSLDGPNEQVNDQIRGSGTFHQTRRGLEVIAGFEDIDFAVSTVLTRLNLGHTIEIARLARSYRARFFNLVMVTADGRARRNKEDLLISVSEFCQEAKSLAQEFPVISNYMGTSFVFDLMQQSNGSSGEVRFVQDEFYLTEKPAFASLRIDGKLLVTPSRILLGNVNQTDFRTLLAKADSSPIVSKHSAWLEQAKRILDKVHSEVLLTLKPSKKGGKG